MAADPDDSYSLEQGAPWVATHPAIERTFQPPPNGVGDEILESLVHPAYPFVATRVLTRGKFDSELRCLAGKYLERIQDTIPQARVFGSSRWAGSGNWDWYDLAWGGVAPERQSTDSRLSFWVEVDGVDEFLTSRTVVLLAGPQYRDRDGQRTTGGGQGLRIVLHVGPTDRDENCCVRITGATFGNPPIPADPDCTESLGEWDIEMFANVRLHVEATLGQLNDQDFAVDQLSLVAPGIARVAGKARVGSSENPRVKAWALQSKVVDRRLGEFQYEYLVDLVTYAADCVNAIDQDPASSGPPKSMVDCRPTRDEARLATYMKPADSLPPVKSPCDPHHELQNSTVPPRITVKGTYLARNTLDPKILPQNVPAKNLPLRSDDQAAAHAYLRGLELMERLHLSGLRPERYFRFAKLPLVLRHHANMIKGDPDGNSVNAQVQPLDVGQTFTEPFVAGKRPQLEVRFGASNLTHRDRSTTFDGRRRLQHLGLAADRRWAWHEFGHVLSWASTGELEFPFAHSAGDALAAIVNDPDSHLAHDELGCALRAESAAGMTFPWVRIKRRHDRDANLGWCWCGRRNIRRLSPLPVGARVFTGYFAEQILSTTLFRLYRALGGDAANSAVRHKAADYTAYLIMRAIQSLGPATTVPASQATHFFEALVQADVGTWAWYYRAHDPVRHPEVVRIGGMAHKVIRWAFEQQGMFATETPGEIVEGIGRPPAVDLHVYGGGAVDDGGYGPVALDWTHDPEASAPGWHATAEGLYVQSSILHFKVRNRGSKAAQGVKTRAWAAPAGPGPLDWQLLDAQQHPPSPLDIGPGGDKTFKFGTSLNGQPLCGAYFFAASATCSGDRSNLDRATGLPCAGALPRQAQQLAELVAGDNNIGLVLLDLGALTVAPPT